MLRTGPHRSRRWARRLSVCAVVAGPMLGSAAGAQPKGAGGASSASIASVDFVVLAGTKASVSAIPSGHPGLGGPPWTMYNHYVASSAKVLALAVGKTVKESLASGHLVTFTLRTASSQPQVDVVLTSGSGAPLVKASMTSTGKWSYPFHVPHAGGGLVIGVRP